MALDLSDEALGLPPAKGNGLDLSDEALGLPPAKIQRPATGVLPGPLGVLQQQFAPELTEEMLAAMEGVYSLATQSYAGLKGIFKGTIAKTAGLSFGETFREEFDASAKNAADAYVPLSPEAGTLTHKVGELLTSGIQYFGDQVFERGIQLPGIAGVVAPGVRVGKGSPAAAAAAQTATVGALFTTPLGRRRGASSPPPGPAPLTGWESFATKYPEAAKAIDAGSLGAVRWREIRGDSIMDIVNKQMDTELGLSGPAKDFPFRTKATMVFDKAAPNVSLGEKLRAVQSVEKKIMELDAARLSLSQERGLPAPSAVEGPITVTAEGQALTPKQARTLAQELRRQNPEQRAEALGVSVMGQLKKQYQNVAKHAPDTPEYNMELRALDRMWRQAFPDEVIGKRSEAFDAFMNFKGDMTYPQVLQKLGPESKLQARYWEKVERRREKGMIDIEGLEYLLNSFRDLPDKPVLKRATIVGQLNRQGVPQAEKDVVLRALGDKDTITQAELVGNVSMNILPLKPEKLELQPHDILDNAPPEFKIGIRPGSATIRVWEGPVKHGIETNHPEIYKDSGIAHTRYFDRGAAAANTRLSKRSVVAPLTENTYSVIDLGTGERISPVFRTADEAKLWRNREFSGGTIRSIAEIQSDLLQSGLRKPEPNTATQEALGTVAMGLERGDFTVGNVAAASGFFRASSVVREQLFLSENAIRNMSKEDLIARIEKRIDELYREQPTDTAIRQQILPLEKRWYERIIMEENRLAAQEGVSKLRVATPETVAKVEFFPPGGKLVRGVYDIPPTEISGGRKVIRARVGDEGDPILLSLEGGGIVESNRLRMGEWAPILKLLPRKPLPEHQTILDFYKREVVPFIRSRYNAKEVVDEFGNTWMEWPVDPAAATQKIPAFGGRQRGIIDVPEWGETQAKRAGEAAEKATTRGWGTPQPADDKLYAKTKDAFEASRKAEEEGHKVTLKSALKKAREITVAHDYDLRAELAAAGPYGEKAVSRIALQNGATMAAKSRMDAINDRVFSNLTREEKTQVDELMRLRRIIEIDSYKGVGKHKHPEGITGPDAEAVAIRMKRELGEEKFAKLYDTTNRIMKEYKDILGRRHEAGLLSDDSYLKLLHFDYSPTEFIDLIDPMQTFTVRGHKISVRTSGVPFLERGKSGRVVMDSQLLLAEALVRSENLIFKNETMKQLHALASAKPDNPIVRLADESMIGKAGTPDAYLKTSPKGWTGLGVRFEGRQDFILMREDMAEQFIHRPQVMPELVGTVARIATGTSALKATAVTYNPFFVTVGLPMDIMHVWLASSRHYSKHLPSYTGQMAADLAATAHDAWTKGPEYQQALREGLGSAFMTHEGRGFTGITSKSFSVAERQMMPRFDKLKSALSYMNESADIWVRMAHRHRLINQGVPSWEATGMARNRLDYSAGGELTRAVDTVMPYTNVAVQALSKVIQAGAKDKADLAAKLAWAGGAIVAWNTANMIASPETWQQIPTNAKIRFLPITFGDQWYVLDADGNKRYVYMSGVRLDAVVAPYAASLISGLEYAEYGKVPDDIMRESIQNLNPVIEFSGPPIWEAIRTYASNFDAYTGRPVTPHFGQVKPENEGLPYGRGEPPSLISRAIGGAAGMSPPRLDAAARKVLNTNNAYLSLMGWGLKELFEGNDPRTQAQATEELLLKNPAVRPFIRLTSPSTRYLQDIEDVRTEEGSRRKQMTDSVDNLMFQVRHQQATMKDVQTYVSNQPPEDREWLQRYATTTFHVKEVMKQFQAGEGIPNETWWRAVAALPARPRAQEFHSQWLAADPEDRKRMEAIAVNLQRRGAGFYSDDFKRELMREKALLGEERR